MLQPDTPAKKDSDPLETGGVDQALDILASHQAENVASMAANLQLYESLIEHFPGGLCAFDENLNMTVCNERLKELLDYPTALFSDGLPNIEQLFRFKASRGEYGPGDIETHVQSRLRLVQLRQPHQYERELPDGRIIEVRGRPLDGGGFVTTYMDVTEQRNHACKLEALVDSFPGGICVFDRNFKMILCNETLKKLSPNPESMFAGGLPDMEDYIRTSASHGAFGNGDPTQIAADRLLSLRQGKFLQDQYRQSGGRYIEISTLPLKDGGFVETQIDITKERTRTLQLESLIENFPGGLSMFDDQLKLVLHNDQFKELLDYPEEILEREDVTFSDLLVFNAERGEFGHGEVKDLVDDRLKLVKGNQPHRFERIRPDGTALEIRGVPLEDGGFLSTYTDITERLQRQADALKMANYSALTGLPNRSLFQDRLEVALAQAERGAKMAVLYIDLHEFGVINTTSGQKAGDHILMTLGKRFREVKRDTDTYAYLGADEFAIIQVGIESIEGAEILARRILRTIREPIEFGNQIYELDACIGVALAPENGTFSDEIQAKVETALHHAKIVGPGMTMFFHNCANRTYL